MKRIMHSTVLMTLLSCSSVTLADEGLMALYGGIEEISLATGTQRPMHLAPAVASVITAQQIRDMGATTLDEALEMVPGLHVSLSQVKNFQSVYSIRGIHTQWNPQVLLLMNGAPIKYSLTGSRYSSFKLPATNISRIEIIRGPGSAVHGADAFAGVINVVTFSAAEIDGLKITGRAGSFNRRHTALQYGTETQNWDIAASLEYSRSDGDDNRRLSADTASALGTSLSSQYPLQTDYEVINTQLNLENKQWSIFLSGWIQNDAGTGPGVAHAIDPDGRTTAKSYQADIEYTFTRPDNDWQISSRLIMERELDKNQFGILPAGSTLPIGDDGNIGTAPHANCPPVTIPNGTTAPLCLTQFPDGVHGNPESSARKYSWSVDAISQHMIDHKIRLQAGLTYQNVSTAEYKNFGPGTPAEQIGETSPYILDGNLTNVSNAPHVYMDDQTRRSWFVVAQDEWHLAPDWTLTAGARYDKFSDFGSTFNPRLALVWAMDYNLTGKLLYGSAFRAPSLGELYLKNNPATIGNRNLSPETIDMLELAFDYRPAYNWQHNVNLFYYQADDLIDYARTAAGNVSNNLFEQKGYGLELETEWQPSKKTEITAAYAWQQSENQNTHAEIPHAPQQQLTVMASWKPDFNTTLFTSVNHVMDRPRPMTDTRRQLDDYTTVNLTARRQVSNNVELSGSIRNLLNDTRHEPSPENTISDDYPLEQRNFYLEFRYHLL